ncbi:MAG TPA: amidase [Caulobacteraceae bacterium]|nr:amidase [Caulobacteraceae bacterium]
MKPAEYLAQDAVGLADLIARKEVSAAEVLEAAIARMEAVNPKVNAVIRPLVDDARALAAKGTPAGPLGGAPYLIKDISALMKGVPTTNGSRLFANNVPAADSAIVENYRAAGLVIFGKSNTPELGLEPVTEPELFGPSRNPWDLSRTPGGSSGGAAAAVAAGIVPAAHASDGGGSIRGPAACSGLFGMKPSRARVSSAPNNEGWGGFSIQHAVTRSVRDSAALLDAVRTPRPGDPYWAQPPERPYGEEVGRDPGKLRIAFSTEALASKTGLDPAFGEAVRDAARLCASLGHEVEEVTVPGDAYAARAAAGVVVGSSVAADLDAEGDRRGKPVSEGEVDAFTWAFYQQGRTIPAAAYIRALKACHAYGRTVATLFSTHDVLITATMGKPAVPIGWLRGDPVDARGYADRLFEFMPNTQAFNITGQPAMTVPLAWTAGGLPIGIQFVGRQADEATLFRLAAQLEAARPWAHRRPAGFE